MEKSWNFILNPGFQKKKKKKKKLKICGVCPCAVPFDLAQCCFCPAPILNLATTNKQETECLIQVIVVAGVVVLQ